MPDSVGKSQLAIYVAPDVSAGDPGMVEICGNRLEVGDQQVGILVASAASTRISDNRVSLAAAGSVFWPNRLVARQWGAFVASHISAAKAQPAPGPAPGPGPAPAPAGPAAAGSLIFRNRPGPGDQPRQRGQPVHRRDHPDPAGDQRLRQEHVGDPAGRERSSGVAIARYVAASATEPHQGAIGAASAGFIAAAVRNARSMAQGIVVGGSRAPLVRTATLSMAPSV